MRPLQRLLFLTLLVLLPAVAFSQIEKYRAYIQQYRSLAIEQMRKHQIPASITMAQGLLESGAGTSTLAVKGNNHFGIKCHNDWTGPYMLRNDDAPNERFRVYSKVEESYEDHSLFLKRNRYAKLFTLPVTDYKAWAHGLKAAGYATSPTYAQNLIQIIERYNLHELDKEGLSKNYQPVSTGVATSTVVTTKPTQSTTQGHVIKINNKAYYVIALQGDTYKSIAREFELSERKLRKFNEVSKRTELKAGDIVYISKKQSRAHKSLKDKHHQLKAGESLYLVSQMYGVRLKTLYKINHFTPDQTLRVGDKIRLR